jgi:PAS domain S-box-containing protein
MNDRQIRRSDDSERQVEDVRRWLAAIVDSSDDVIISKTLDGVILSWNLAAQRLFGYSEQEAVGQPITIIIPPELHDEKRKSSDGCGPASASSITKRVASRETDGTWMSLSPSRP